ncbi:cytochrome P450 [Saccharothrix sp. NRRL B-16348]|uniref:cytochrome P450 n=1 Tax=Saccharothrix sp. NRRL B-16348 TaxID=1415542 RepID=UPI000A644FCC|nr:cytochrome P450 [Saccharothrix sp. NRRL B-16348]
MSTEMRRFRRDPLTAIEHLRHRARGDVFRLPWGDWCVGDADLARAVLRDPVVNDGMSAFFGALLPSRPAQVAVGRAVRDLVRARVPDFRHGLAAAVAGLPADSAWPEAGIDLVHRAMADLLLHPGTPDATRWSLARAARGGVLIRPPRVWQRARAEVLRGRLLAGVAEQVAERRARAASEPRDVLDAVLGACPDGMADRTVAELFALLFRAIVAPVGCTVAWSVLLACLHTSASPWPWPVDWVVREALRHRPMAWMVVRPAPAGFGDVPVRSGEVLSVSPYLAHHDERLWADPDAFRPDRWAEPSGHGPYLPFGAGRFTCAGASPAQVLITGTVAALADDARLTVTGGDTRPVMADGLVPRPFTLHRRAKEVNDHDRCVAPHLHEPDRP